MAEQDWNALKGCLTDYVNSITRRSGGGLYICPLCGSGTGSHKTGAFSITPDGLRWKCFCCDKGGDIFDLCSAHEGIDASESAKRIIARYGNAAMQPSIPGRSRPTPSAEPAKKQGNFSADIARFAAALPGSEGQSYLEGRGFTLETMKRFDLGYNPDKRVITIPYNKSGTYYGQRSVVAGSTRPHDNLAGATMTLFNADALYSSEVVFIVESPLCAISIMQAGGSAVAVSGVPAGNGRLEKQLREKATSAALIICYDNDDPGRNATDDLAARLESLGVFCVNGTSAIMGEETDKTSPDFRKDPNEVLQRSGAAALEAAVRETIEETSRLRESIAQTALEERQQRAGESMVDSFLEEIQTRKFEPMPTGITDIDRAIGGGFIRQQLILLGAAPGVGKTALAQWIFEGMARRGTPCVYLNLEMSREQILARSISRIARQHGHTVKTTDILQGYKWTEQQRNMILRAAEEYKREISPRMIYNPDGTTANLDGILAYIEKEAQLAEQANQSAPMVVLDYLQIVSGQSGEDSATLIKRAVKGLKDYAVRHNTVVFVIIAHNRKANESGDVGMGSGRDTSALEYSADLQMALTYTLCIERNGNKKKDPDALTPEERRKITLRITKGRFGGVGTDVDLLFNGESMTYSQIAKEEAPERMKVIMR